MKRNVRRNVMAGYAPIDVHSYNYDIYQYTTFTRDRLDVIGHDPEKIGSVELPTAIFDDVAPHDGWSQPHRVIQALEAFGVLDMLGIWDSERVFVSVSSTDDSIGIMVDDVFVGLQIGYLEIK